MYWTRKLKLSQKLPYTLALKVTKFETSSSYSPGDMNISKDDVSNMSPPASNRVNREMQPSEACEFFGEF